MEGSVLAGQVLRQRRLLGAARHPDVDPSALDAPPILVDQAARHLHLGPVRGVAVEHGALEGQLRIEHATRLRRPGQRAFRRQGGAEFHAVVPVLGVADRRTGLIGVEERSRQDIAARTVHATLRLLHAQHLARDRRHTSRGLAVLRPRGTFTSPRSREQQQGHGESGSDGSSHGELLAASIGQPPLGKRQDWLDLVAED
jgi:hypothetical protein